MCITAMISHISRIFFYNQLVGSIVCLKRSDQMSVSFAQKNSTIWLEVFSGKRVVARLLRPKMQKRILYSYDEL